MMMAWLTPLTRPPKADKHPDSNDPTIVVPGSDDMGSRKSGSNVDGSTSPRNHNSSKSDVEVVTVQTTARTKMPKSTSTTRDSKTDAPGPSEPNPDVDNVSEAELRDQWYQDARLLDKDFGTWHDNKISEGCKGWKKCTKMHCDHGESHNFNTKIPSVHPWGI